MTTILGPFEKLVRGGKLKTLDGREYVRKVSENCVAYMKSDGTYGDEEEKAIEKFREAFKDQNFPPGASVFYKQSPSGTLGVSNLHERIKFESHNLSLSISQQICTNLIFIL